MIREIIQAEETPLPKRGFDGFISGTVDPIVAFDQHFVIRCLSESAAKLFGSNFERMIGMRLEDCGPIGSILAPALASAMEKKQEILAEHELSIDGSDRFFQGIYSPIVSHDNVTGVFCLLREINRPTGIPRLTYPSSRAEAHVKALEVFDMTAESDLSGQILYANEKFCVQSKYSRHELIGKNFRIFNSGHHPKTFFQEMWRAIARGQVWCGEIRNRAKDESLLWIQMIIVPILNEEKKPIRFLALSRDITLERSKSTQMEDSTSYFQQILENNPLKILSLSLERNILFANKAFCDFTGYSEKDLRGKNWVEQFVFADHKQDVQEKFLEMLSGRKKDVRLLTQIFKSDGSSKDVWWRTFLIRERDGTATGIHLVGDELSDVPIQENGRGKMDERDAVRKRDILGFVTHELKGGLTSIGLGVRFITELLDRAESEKARNMLDKVVNQIQYLTTLSTNLLEDIEKQGHPLRLKLQSVSLRTLLLGVKSRFGENLSQHPQLQFDLQLPEEDVIVQWDPVKIEQVILKVLSNAQKYSKPDGGKILLQATVHKEDWVLIEISDEGIGIPAESIDSVLDLFTRGSNVSKEVRGFGLGMKLSKDIILKHYGRIWLESELDSGTSIFLLIPIDPRKNSG